MSIKSEREINGPSWTEVLLGAALSFALGVALSAVALVLKPATTVKELPKDADPAVVYYIEGSRDSTKSRLAVEKQKSFIQGGSVVLNEDELNLLASPNATPAPKKPGEKPGKSEKPAAEPPAEKTITAGTPNFRVRDDVLQIGVPLRVSVAGFDQRVIVQARGSFVKQGDVFVFDPQELYVGSCPLQRIPAARSFLMGKFIAAAAIPEDLSTAWRKLENVAVEKSALHLTVAQ